MPDIINIRRASINVARLGTLALPELGVPESIRWFSLDPTGIVVVRHSANLHGHLADAGMRIQWQLALDVHAVIDPARLLGPVLMQVGDHLDDDKHHVLWLATACTGTAHTDALPINPVASRIWRRLRPEMPVDVYGTVAGIGYVNDADLHQSVRDAELVALQILVAQIGGEVLTENLAWAS